MARLSPNLPSLVFSLPGSRHDLRVGWDRQLCQDPRLGERAKSLAKIVRARRRSILVEQINRNVAVFFLKLT
jgi:hypothetical protein